MRINPGRATAATSAGVAILLAAPAHADSFTGTYLHTAPGTKSTWVVTSCGAGCTHVDDSDGWSADAHLVNGQWTFSIDRPDATKCRNGSRAPGTALYSVNPAKLVGTVVTTNPAPCELAAGYSTPIYFILTKAG